MVVSRPKTYEALSYVIRPAFFLLGQNRLNVLDIYVTSTLKENVALVLIFQAKE